MDYDDWVIAKALLTSQLGFSMDYQMTNQEDDFGIHQAIQFYLDAWSAEVANDSFNKLLLPTGWTQLEG